MSFSRLLAALLLAAPSSADLLVVDASGGGDFTSLDAAVLAANGGDTLLLRTGSYTEATVVGTSLALVAEVGANVRIDSLIVRQLAPGQEVLLRGLEFEAQNFRPTCTLRQNGGLVRVEDCEFLGRDGFQFSPGEEAHPDGGPALLVEQCTGVTLVDTLVRGGRGAPLEDEDSEFSTGDGAVGLAAVLSNVAFLGGRVEGGRGGSVFDTTPVTGGAGGDAATIVSGTLFVAGTEVFGGGGGSGECDGLFIFCSSGGRGGAGLVLDGGATGTLRGADLQGGTGGTDGDFSGSGPDGLPLELVGGATSTELLPAPQFLRANSPVREGANLVLDLAGVPGELAFFQVGATQVQGLFPELAGPLLVGTPVLTQLAGLLDGAGELQLALGVPDLLAPGTAATVHVQGVFYDLGTDEFRLGSASAVTLLDAAD